MAACGILTLQLALAASDNPSATADDFSSERHRYPFANMVVLPELAASGPGLGGGYVAHGAGEEFTHLAGGGCEIIALDIDSGRILRCREPGRQGLDQVPKSVCEGSTRFRACDRAPAERAALAALGNLAQAQRGLPRRHTTKGHGENRI